MDESWKYYAKWKKPEKGHKLHDSIYMKYPEHANTETGKISVVPRGRGTGVGQNEWRMSKGADFIYKMSNLSQGYNVEPGDHSK